MDYTNLRTNRDCQTFNEILSILQLNDYCRDSIINNSAIREIVGDVYISVKRIVDENEFPVKFLDFHKYCAYVILYHTLVEIYENDGDDDSGGASLEKLIEINNTELKFYWNQQHLPTNTAKKTHKTSSLATMQTVV